MKTVTVSSKRQIAIPKDFLEELGVDFGGKLRIEKDKNTLRLTPVKKSITDELAGSLAHLIPKNKRGVPFAKIMEETEKLAVKQLASDGDF